jgi:hypothetical protein
MLTYCRTQPSLASARDQSKTTKSFDLEIIMSTRPSKARVSLSVRRSKDRTSMCLFAFKDGRRCRMLRAADPHLCNYHARREAEHTARNRVGRYISSAFCGEYISATSLSLALARTLAATAEGQLKPKQAAIVASLGRTLLQAIYHSEHEYTETFGVRAWREAIITCFGPPRESPAPPTPPAATPTPPNPDPRPAANASSSNTAPHAFTVTPAPPNAAQQSPAPGPAAAQSESPSPSKPDPATAKSSPHAASASPDLQPPTPLSATTQSNQTASPQATATKSPLPHNPSAFVDQVRSHLRH